VSVSAKGRPRNNAILITRNSRGSQSYIRRKVRTPGVAGLPSTMKPKFTLLRVSAIPVLGCRSARRAPLHPLQHLLIKRNPLFRLVVLGARQGDARHHDAVRREAKAYALKRAKLAYDQSGSHQKGSWPQPPRRLPAGFGTQDGAPTKAVSARILQGVKDASF